MDLFVVILAGFATALATGLGAVPVFLLGERAERLRRPLTALAAGLMLAASTSLLAPAFRDGAVPVVITAGFAGAVFVMAARAGWSSAGATWGPSTRRPGARSSCS